MLGPADIESADAVLLAVDSLCRACNGSDDGGGALLPMGLPPSQELGAPASPQLGASADTPQWRGGLGRSIALRRWRFDNSWSRGSGMDASGGGCPPPWQGAVSGHNSSDTEQPLTSSDVLTLVS